MVSDGFVRFRPFWSAFYRKTLAGNQMFFPQISAFFHSHCHVNVHHHVLESCVHFLKKRLIFCRRKNLSAMSAKRSPGHFFNVSKNVSFSPLDNTATQRRPRACDPFISSVYFLGLDFGTFLLPDTVVTCRSTSNGGPCTTTNCGH